MSLSYLAQIECHQSHLKDTARHNICNRCVPPWFITRPDFQHVSAVTVTVTRDEWDLEKNEADKQVW